MKNTLVKEEGWRSSLRYALKHNFLHDFKTVKVGRRKLVIATPKEIERLVTIWVEEACMERTK